MKIMAFLDILGLHFWKNVEDGIFFAIRRKIKMLNYEEVEDNKKQRDG